MPQGIAVGRTDPEAATCTAGEPPWSINYLLTGEQHGREKKLILIILLQLFLIIRKIKRNFLKVVKFT